MEQARKMTDAKAIAVSDCARGVAGRSAGTITDALIATKYMRTAPAESRQSGHGYERTHLRVPRANMLEMLDRNSAQASQLNERAAAQASQLNERAAADGQRAADLAHPREQHRALDFGVATDESSASGLTLAVHRLIAGHQSLDGPEIEFCHDLSGGELRPVLQASVLCIVRELLANACRHSKSRRILVGIGRDDTHVYIQVQDWGVGFNCTALSPRLKPINGLNEPQRRGLKGVRELVESLGGIVDIDSRPGNGTCIAVEIPVVEEHSESQME